MSLRIDLNCDLGEGAGHDAELMTVITSANIACGAHAGDETTMQATVALARQHGVAIGAHPGFDDRENFGRREWALAASEVRTLVERQVRALQQIGTLVHVKPHGALYNLAARDAVIAEAVAGAVHAVDARLVLFALRGSELVRAGRRVGLRVAEEVFADRTYRADGALTPRAEAGAVITDEAVAIAQAVRMVRAGADTICLHGDGAHVVALARRLHVELRQSGIEIRAFGV
ncbi:MAG: LamB/YcsF family protein [Opitutia bacterium]|nr:LamB/YcsF family protein [Opitutaceae bacterium]PHX71299.1 MAG: LamB/YcsF family protein [Opitutae bacterium]